MGSNSSNLGGGSNNYTSTALETVRKSKGSSYSVNGTSLSQGHIVSYDVNTGIGIKVSHWGIHIGDGYIISKYDDSKIQMHHVNSTV